MQNLRDYKTVKKELVQHVIDRIDDGVIDDTNKDEWQYLCFNDDYYIIGYYDCSQWLEKHEIDAFDAIGICQEYEKDYFGELTKKYDNSEVTVNMLVYVFGEELLNYLDAENIDDLKKSCLAELD